MASVLGVSATGYYAWLRRRESQRNIENKELGRLIEKIFTEHHGIYGSRRIKRELKKKHNKSIGRHCVLCSP